jgi:hypothetical protein
VINLAAKAKSNLPPQELELYYPLSPRKAMLLLSSNSSFMPSQTSIDADEVRRYTLEMTAHSQDQIFARSQQCLERIREDLANVSAILTSSWHLESAAPPERWSIKETANK